MNVRSAVVLLAVISVALGALALPANAQVSRPFNIASESYYTLDVPNGTAKARIEAEIEVAGQGGRELPEMYMWAMPSAKNIVVKQGDAELKTVIKPISDFAGRPNLVVVTLSKPLKPNLRTKLTMTYDVPSQKTELVKMQAGAIEAVFVSQGQGSFTFIDAPAEADTFIEPGCVRVNQQPGAVSDAGLVRYVCGQTLLAAIYSDDSDVQKRCANLDEKCRQRLSASPFIGFVQSITDASKQGHFTEEIVLPSGKSATLKLTFFLTDQSWAQRQFAIAKQALPKLEAVYGHPYPHDQILLRQSNLLLSASFLGIAFTESGEMLITRTDEPNRLDENVAVHELAHQWAGLNLESSWLWEGLAEYGRITISGALGLPARDRQTNWTLFPYKDKLGNWYNGSEVYNPDYWYGKAGAFWVAFATAIGGPENMTRVLGQMDDDPKRYPLDGRWFMDRGEEVSGANLDALFLEWVWLESAEQLLTERRAAHQLTGTLYARTSPLGLEGFPTDLKSDLDRWTFAGIADLVNAATGLVDRYTVLTQKANENSLPVGDGFSKAWNTKTLPELGTLLGSMEAAITAIANGAKQVAQQPGDTLGSSRLEEARAKFLAGEYTEAQRLAVSAATSTANKEAAEKLIAFAEKKQRDFKPSFFQKIGLYFSDPNGKVASAKVAYAATDYEKALLDSKSAIETWDGAKSTGIFRLALLLGAMAAMFVGGWWAVKKLDKTPEATMKRPSHDLGDQAERSGTWREWLEQKESPPKEG